MKRDAADEPEALRRLQTLAGSEGRKLIDVAQTILAEKAAKA